MHDTTSPPKKNAQCELKLFYRIKEGRNPSTLWTDNTFTRRQVDYALSKLRHDGFVKKVGYGTWEILKERTMDDIVHHVTKTHMPKERTKQDRGHGFVATLKLPIIQGWQQRKEIMGKAGIHYVPFDEKRTQRIVVGDIKKVWLSDRSITFYLGKKNFFAENAYKSSWDAMEYLLQHISKLEALLKISLRINKRYHIKFSRSHHALIKNALAKQFNDEKRKVYVYDENGLWLLIDHSEGTHELEFVRNETNVNENDFFRTWYNEMNETRLTPKFTLHIITKNSEDIGKLTGAMTTQAQNMESYSQNLVSHVAAIQTLGSKVDEFSSIILQLNPQIRRKLKKPESAKPISEFVEVV